MNSKILNYLTETVSRFLLKSPKYFNIIQKIGVLAAAIGFMPDIAAYLNISIPANQTLELILKVAGATTYLISKLPVENSSAVIKGTDQLPFSDVNKTEANKPKETIKTIL